MCPRGQCTERERHALGLKAHTQFYTLFPSLWCHTRGSGVAGKSSSPPTSSVFVSVRVFPTACASTIGSFYSSRRGGPNTNHCALREDTFPSSGSARQDGPYAPSLCASRQEESTSSAPLGQAARGSCGGAAFASCGRYQPDKLQDSC